MRKEGLTRNNQHRKHEDDGDEKEAFGWTNDSS